MFGSRYQQTSLTSASFENGISTINTKFTFTLKIETILIVKHITKPDFNLKSTLCIDNLLKPTSFISVNNTIYIIITNII